MTELSGELIEALDAARRRLSLSPDGHLILGSRQRIWAAMGPRLRDGNRAFPSVGLARRTALAVACVKQVLPLWEQRLPQDRSPHALLGLIGRYLRGTADYESLYEEAGELWLLADNLCYRARGNRTAVFMVACAASRAAGTALKDEWYGPDHIDPDASDDDRDAWEWDAAFYAALVYSGGNPLSHRSDPARLRAFWDWYVTEAAPVAWIRTEAVD